MPGFSLTRRRTQPPQEQSYTGVLVNGFPVRTLKELAQVGGFKLFGESVTREEALTIPSVIRARNLLIAAVTSMPLHVTRANGTAVDSTWLDQPDPNRTRSAMLTDTVDDLFFDGAACWRASRAGGFPLGAEFVSVSRVGSRDGRWTIDGAGVDKSEVIYFEGLTFGILRAGGGAAIRDALNLQRAAKLFSDSPIPLGYFTARQEGVDPEDTVILKFLGEWEAARRSGAYGYVPSSLKLETPAVDPEKLQLAETRKHADLEIARSTNSEPEDLGISTTTRTYFNASQQRKDSLDFNSALYTRPIEERLSMTDVTPRGQQVRFNYDAFLRTDTLSRYQAYEIGLRAGFLDVDEVRATENLPPRTQTPAAKPAAGSEESEGTR